MTTARLLPIIRTPITAIIHMDTRTTGIPLTDIPTTIGGTTRTRGHFTHHSFSVFTGITSATLTIGSTTSTVFMAVETSPFKDGAASRAVRPGHPLRADLRTVVLSGQVRADVPLPSAARAPVDLPGGPPDWLGAAEAVLEATQVALPGAAGASVGMVAAIADAGQWPITPFSGLALPA